MSRRSVIAAAPTIPRSPTKREVRETRLLIDQRQSELVTCEERIAELLSLFEASTDEEVKVDLQNQINDTITKKEELILQTNARESPIRRLPSELLALVMVCHVHENGQSPLSLLAVSKTWRYLGIETPRLWSLIHILSTPMSTIIGGAPYHHLARCPPVDGILCRHERSWEMILDRSGAVPLDLIIECDTSIMSLEFFSRIVLQSSHRWRSVVLDIKESVRPWDVGNLSLVFPNLRSATFLMNCTGGQLTNALVSAFETSSTRIHSMTLRSTTLLNHFVSKPTLLQRIKEFDCSGLGVFGLFQQYDLLWFHLSRLEGLTMRDDAATSSWCQKADYFTRLQVLAVWGFPLPQLGVLSKLKSLTHLYLEYPLMAPPEQHSIKLTNVTHFSLNHSGYNILGTFVLPSIISLELLGNLMPPSAANQELDYIWNLETFGKAPSPLTLHLEVKANDAYLLMALRSMDRLKDLRLIYDAPQANPSKLLESLAVKPKKSVLAKGAQALRKWVPPTCPELETLSLLYKSRLKRQEEEDISEKLQRILEARMGTAREMKDVRFLSLKNDRHQTTNLGRRNMELGLA